MRKVAGGALRAGPALLLAVLVACGGGGSGSNGDGDPDPGAPPTLTSITPGTLLSTIPDAVTVRGTGLGTAGQTATLRFGTPAGPPVYLGGTASTADVPLSVVSPTEARGTLPFAFCTDRRRARLTFIHAGGAEVERSGGPWLVPHVRQLENSHFDRQFGSSVAIEGDLALIGLLGAPIDDSAVAGQGALYEIHRWEAGGAVDFRLVGSAGRSGARAGTAVALTTTWGHVGMPGSALTVTLPGGRIEGWLEVGAVLAFPVDRDAGTDSATMGATSELRASDASADDRFGEALAADGSRLLVGAPGNDFDLFADAGTAYVFRTPSGAGAPVEEVRLLPFQGGDTSRYDGGTDDAFATSVAMEGDLAVVGAPLADGTVAASGAAYLYELHNDSWQPLQKLIASDGVVHDHFGASVAVAGDTVFVGAPRNSRRNTDAGTVYVFVRDGGGVWQERQRLDPSGDPVGQRAGSAVAARGGRLVVGAPEDSNRGVAKAGAAFVFERSGDGSWREVYKLVAPVPGNLDWYGAHVALDGGRILIGAPWAGPLAGFVILY